MVTLIGLITKHGILIVELCRTNRRDEKGISPLEAVLNASLLRLRPILMTTAAMVFRCGSIGIGRWGRFWKLGK